MFRLQIGTAKIRNSQRYFVFILPVPVLRECMERYFVFKWQKSQERREMNKTEKAITYNEMMAF